MGLSKRLRLASVLALAAMTASAAAQEPLSSDVSWIRAFAERDITGEAGFFLPDYYETEQEAAVRAALTAYLSSKGVDLSKTDETRMQISYSVKMSEVEGKQGLPKSALRLEPKNPKNRDPARVDIDPTETGFRPVLAFGDPPKGEQNLPSLRVSVFVLDEHGRAWTGYAEGDLGGVSARELAARLTTDLMTYWGRNSPAAGTAPAAGDGQ